MCRNHLITEAAKTDALLRLVGELVSDMCRESDPIRVKLRKEGEKAELFLRSLGPQHNLPRSIYIYIWLKR